MVDGIGKGSLAREAIRAALDSQTRAADAVRAASRGVAGAEQATAPGAGVDFAQKLSQGIDLVDAQVKSADNIPEDMLSGKIQDFHEVAVQLKKADLTFRYAMEIRNKLIDAYREVMRMSV